MKRYLGVLFDAIRFGEYDDETSVCEGSKITIVVKRACEIFNEITPTYMKNIFLFKTESKTRNRGIVLKTPH